MPRAPRQRRRGRQEWRLLQRQAQQEQARPREQRQQAAQNPPGLTPQAAPAGAAAVSRGMAACACAAACPPSSSAGGAWAFFICSGAVCGWEWLFDVFTGGLTGTGQLAGHVPPSNSAGGFGMRSAGGCNQHCCPLSLERLGAAGHSAPHGKLARCHASLPHSLSTLPRSLTFRPAQLESIRHAVRNPLQIALLPPRSLTFHPAQLERAFAMHHSRRQQKVRPACNLPHLACSLGVASGPAGCPSTRGPPAVSAWSHRLRAH